MILPIAGWPTNTLSQGSSWPSGLRTMVPQMVAQDWADTLQDRARIVAKSWAPQDSIHLLQACAAAAIHWGNVDMASLCVMYDPDSSNACRGAR